jgi:hypothetical protein
MRFSKRIFPILLLFLLMIPISYTQAGFDRSLDNVSNTGGQSSFSPDLASFSSQSASSVAAVTINLPEQTDWQAKGVAIQQGADGQWDRYLWGGFANSLIKKGSTYFLYYQGSPYYDYVCESVAYRAIGVATSTDGINWTKYQGNPVISWSSQGSVEEGAASAAAWVGSDGKVYIYYGANSGSGCNVTTNGRLAVSTDGLTFTDQGSVISGQNSAIWGYGDEIFPLGAYEHLGTWNVFYTPNGTAQSRKLGVVSGNSPTSLTTSAGVNGGTVPVWGTVSTVMNEASSVLFVNDGGTDLPLKAYRFNAADPKNITLDKTYFFSDCARFSVLYDAGLSRWLMLCTDRPDYTGYKIKIASQAAAAPTATAISATATPAATSTPLATMTSMATATPAPILAPSNTPTALPTLAPAEDLSPGALSGTVSSSQGGTLSGAKVTVRNDSYRSSVNTDSAGNYSIAKLPAGTYSVKYSKGGYEPINTQVTILPGIATDQDVTLNKR